MTILTDYVPISYAGNNVTNSFAITFDFQVASQIVANTEVVATGVITPLVYGTDFSITPTVNSPAGFGTLTLLLGALPSGTNILITRVTDVTQDTSWINNSANPASAFENAVDKLTMIDQEREVTPFDLDGTTDQFLRGDNTLTNTLVGPLGAFVLPADTTAMFIAGQSADASIKVVGGASSQSAFSFGVDGSANPWDARWVYDASLPAIGWQVFGGPIVGTFDSSGLSVTGTVNATLFTGAADASLITTGVLDVARVGTSSGSANSFLNGLGQFTIPTGGGGINTTTTGTFTIAAVASSQTVPVTSVTGIVAGTELLIADGTHAIIGHVTVVSSLNLTFVTDSIQLGIAGNTMASGASVQASAFPGNNTILVADEATSPASYSTVTFVGEAAGRPLGLSNVSLYIDHASGSNVAIAGYANTFFTIGSLHAASTSNDLIAYKPKASSQWTFLDTSTLGAVLHADSTTTLAFGKITASDSITAATITPVLLNATNSLTNGYVPSYDSGTGHFTWVANGGSIPGGGTSANFFRGDNTFTNSLAGPINIDLSSSTTFRIGVANVFGGTTPVQAYMEPVVSGTPTVLPLQIASQVALGGTQYNTIDTTNVIETLQVNAIARATSFRSTCGPWLEIYELGVGGGATAIDLVNGSYQRFTSLGSNITVTLADTSPLPNARRFSSELTLEFNAMSTFDVTWPGTITWANSGIAPTVANSGLNASGINVVKLIRRQGQTQWVGFVENPSTSGSGSVTSIIAGTGLSGGTITTSGTIAIATGGVTTSLIANLAVTSAQIANNTITNGQIANNTVTVGNIQGGTAAGGNSSLFLNAGGTWTAPSGGGGGGGPTLSSNNPWSGVNSWSNTSTFTGAINSTSTSVNAFSGLTRFTHPAWTDLNSPYATTLVQPYYEDGTTGSRNLINVQLIDSSAGSQGYKPISSYVAALNPTRTASPNGVDFYLDVRGTCPANEFAISTTSVVQSANVAANDVRDSVWLNAWGPCIAFQSTPANYTNANLPTTHSYTAGGVVRIGECNYGNAWSDLGFVDDRGLSGYFAGLEFFPAWLAGTCADFYGGSPPPQRSFNVQWAIAVGGAAPGSVGPSPKNWTGILFDKEAIVAGGIGINMHGSPVSTTTTGTFAIAAVGASQTVPVASTTGMNFSQPSGLTTLQISDGTHTILGYVTNISSLNLTFVTDEILAGTAGNTMASSAVATSGPGVGLNFQNSMGTGINFAGSAGGAPIGTGGGTAASFTSTGNAAITMADDQSIKLGSIWLRGHSGALQYSTNGTSWSNVTLP